MDKSLTRRVLVLLCVLVLTSTSIGAQPTCRYYCVNEIDRAICFPVNDHTAHLTAPCEEKRMCYGPTGDPWFCQNYCEADQCAWI